jgi:hypothetical protein
MYWLLQGRSKILSIASQGMKEKLVTLLGGIICLLKRSFTSVNGNSNFDFVIVSYKKIYLSPKGRVSQLT